MNLKDNQPDTGQNIPSKQQLINYFKEQSEVKQHQLKMQELNTRIAKLRAEEVEAYAKIAMITHGQHSDEQPERPTGPDELAGNPLGPLAQDKIAA